MYDRIRVAAGAAAVAGAAVLAGAAMAGGDKVAFPEGYDKGVLYATIDRADTKQYRELFSTPEAVEAVKAGKPIPSGSVLTLVQYKAVADAAGTPVKDANGRYQKGELIGYTVMEKRTGWGAEYPDDVRNGEWEYQAFKADKSVNDKANLKNCFACHKPYGGLDYVFSLISMKSGPAPATGK